MSISETHGNLLEADAEALVNSVNTVGVMGKGVALQFRRAFPGNYKAYVEAHRRGELAIGRMFVWERGTLEGPRLIINFPTKRHWRSASKLEDIEAGLAELRRVLIDRDVESVAVPPLGCGLGGLRWSDVRPRIDAALGDLPIRVLVFPPQEAPAAEAMADATEPPRMTPGRAALLAALSRYLEAGARATLLEVQKLLYFLQEAGEPLKLHFTKQQYGPYADAVRHVLRQLEGHYLSGFGDGTRAGGIALLPNASDEGFRYLEGHPLTQDHLDRALRLVEGFEGPYGLELLATTHWVVTREHARALDAAIAAVQDWSRRKDRLFTPRHIELAWTKLLDEGWINPPQAVAESAIGGPLA